MARMTRDQYARIVSGLSDDFNPEDLRNDIEPAEFAKFKERVKKGEVPINKHIRDQIKLIDDMVKNPDFYVNPHAIRNFERFVDGEMTLTDGTPARGKMTPAFKLWAEDALSWFQKVERLEMDPVTHKKVKVERFERVRRMLVLIVGRGNAKSLFMTWLAAYLVTTSSQKIDAIAAADSLEHANLILEPFRVALSSPVGRLLEFTTQRWVDKGRQVLEPQMVARNDEIVNTVTGSTIRMSAMRNASFQSSRPNLVLLDEVHQVREDVIQSAKESASKTQNPLVIITTSEGTIRDGVFDDNKIGWRRLLSGEAYDPTTSVWWYSLDSREEINDPDTWEKANPNLGITVQPSTLELDLINMKNKPSDIPNTMSHRFGLETAETSSFFTAEETKRSSDFQPYNNEPVAMGIDLSQRDDLTSFTFLWKRSDGIYQMKTRSYTPTAKYQKLAPIYRQKYDEAEAEGSLVFYEGDFNEPRPILADLIDYITREGFSVEAVGYDRAYSQEWMEIWRQEMGDFNTEPINQSALRLSSPMYMMKEAASNGHLIHDQALMSWAMSNLKGRVDMYGNVKPDKQRSDDKIDPIAAGIDAFVVYQEKLR